MLLSERLVDWCDWDVAMHEVGVTLGLVPEDFASDAKGIYWTSNPLGDALHQFLVGLVQAGVLERRQEPDEQFRWQAEPRGQVTRER